MIIKHAFITKFRALQNVEFDLGKKITAIVGQNGTMKTTVLGILSQTFTISKEHKMHGEQTIDGYNFHSQFGENLKCQRKTFLENICGSWICIRKYIKRTILKLRVSKETKIQKSQDFGLQKEKRKVWVILKFRLTILV